ncbi:hypothetical protein L198_02457 [Cryptococcus wingfieldii CBS 7118]|uniref:Uncharacterized protein n=1 Tax=Cryptococcus wingfieldii CBS 7118 TaxID=1295528 RepID=A0A1E3JTZ4_9TREE|nr:hypothetical protein L198_02457 [Cryptococcus wingfieldii CBS 7118]ODO03607.1 hypothetical protein L198_02457 [Cryptococcus wingfieldii CBS 7118]
MDGECITCEHVLCQVHFNKSVHLCEALKFGNNLLLLKSLNLEQLASSLRPGHSCQAILPLDQDSMMRGQNNVVCPIHFGDAIQWMAKVGQGSRNSLQLDNAFVESELATIEVLAGLQGNVPHALLFLDMMSGPRLDLRIYHPDRHPSLPAPAQTFIHGLADLLISLTSQSFDKIGSFPPNLIRPAKEMVAQMTMVFPGYFNSNSLDAFELYLVDVLSARGRHDLADCVKGARLYHNLLLVENNDLDLPRMELLREIMGRPRMEREEWMEWALERFKEDVGLDKVRELAAETVV